MAWHGGIVNVPAARRLFASGVLIIPPNKLQPELLTLNLPLNICITLGRVVPCYGGEETDERLELGGGGPPYNFIYHDANSGLGVER